MLRFEVAPYEKIYFGKSVLINSHERAMFSIEGTTPLLRGKDFLLPELAGSVSEKLYLCIQTRYLHEKEGGAEYREALHAFRKEDAVLADKVDNQVCAGALYRALRDLKAAVGRDKFTTRWEKPANYVVRPAPRAAVLART